jgi:hypothetical protein
VRAREADRVHDRTQVVHALVHRRQRTHRVRHAGAALVEHRDSREAAKPVEPVAEARAVPVIVDVGDESRREDEPGRAVVADQLARGLDPAAEGGVGHHSAVPDGLEQLVARDHAVAVPEQKDQELQDLGFDRQRAPVAGDLDAGGVGPEFAEAVNHDAANSPQNPSDLQVWSNPAPSGPGEAGLPWRRGNHITGGFVMTVNVATQEPQAPRPSLSSRAGVLHPKRRRSARTPRSARARLAAAFMKAGVAVGAKQAFEQTKGWCRASGGAWAQSLG